MARLVVFAGPPASGKSTIARELAQRTDAIWLRVDSMDQAIWASGTAPADLQDWTYRAAQALAADNLRLGRDVIGDCVNDRKVTRDAWDEAGKRAGAEVVFVEVVCADPIEHRRRVETRSGEIAGLVLPGWRSVVARRSELWDRDRLTIDTAGRSIAECVEHALAALRADPAR